MIKNYSKIYLGDNSISKAYVGSNVVYTKEDDTHKTKVTYSDGTQQTFSIDGEITKNSITNVESATSIAIGDAVTSIGISGFTNCTSLTSVTIPTSVTSIGTYAFRNCSGLTSVDIPNSVTIIGIYAFYNCNSLTSIDIPNSVTSIGNQAFMNCKCLTSVTIPNSVTSIGIQAFQSCSGLTSVTIPNSVTSIGNQAFNGIGMDVLYSENGKFLCHVSTATTSFDIAEGTEQIVGGAFYNCSKLTSVTIPSSVTSIGDYAFFQCSNLRSVVIPNSVTTIGGFCFQNCSGLTNVTIPNSVTSIDKYAFRGCTSLTSIDIPNSVTSIGTYAFYNCSGLTSIDIPNSVTSIGNSAFCKCSGLTYVNFGNDRTTVPTLGNANAFQDTNDCPIVVPDALYNDWKTAKIWSATTYNVSTRLIKYSEYFPQIVTATTYAIQNMVYDNSVEATVTSATISYDGVTTYHYSDDTTSSTTETLSTVVEFDENTSTQSTKVNTGTITYNTASATWTITQQKAVIQNPTTVTYIDYSSVDYDIIGSIYGSGEQFDAEPTTQIDNVTDAKRIVLSTKVTSIGKNAFVFCRSLTSVTIPNSVTSIGEGAFYSCSGLTSITIPSSVTSIGGGAFSECLNLETLNFGGTIEQFAAMTKGEYWSNGIKATVVHCSDGDCDLEGNPIGGVTTDNLLVTYSDGGYMFNTAVADNVKSAFSKAIIDGTQEISNEEFETVETTYDWNDNDMVTAQWDSSLSKWVTYFKITKANDSGFVIENDYDSYCTFYRDGEDLGVHLYGYSDSPKAMYDGEEMYIYEYGQYALNTIDFVTVYIDGLTTIKMYSDEQFQVDPKSHGWEVFGVGSSSVEYYSLPSGEHTVEFVPSQYWDNIPQEMFFNKSNISSVEIGKNITEIKTSAFLNCFSVTSVTIGSGVTKIGMSAFQGCDSLINVTIGNSVTSISQYAFRSCVNLKTVTINNGTSVIGWQMFQGCTSLTSVTIPNSVTSIGSQAFNNCSSLPSITFPQYITTIAYQLLYGCRSLSSLNYDGTIEQWNALSKGSYWNYGVPATVVHCSDGDVSI